MESGQGEDVKAGCPTVPSTWMAGRQGPSGFERRHTDEATTGPAHPGTPETLRPLTPTTPNSHPNPDSHSYRHFADLPLAWGPFEHEND